MRKLLQKRLNAVGNKTVYFPMDKANMSITGKGVQRGAFTLIELMVVLAIIGILTAMLLPALATGKESGRRISCVNNMRQMAIAHQMYADDNDFRYYKRSKNPLWTYGLEPYYANATIAGLAGTNGQGATKILICPDDSKLGHDDSGPPDYPHSYIMNAWNDYFTNKLTAAQWKQYMQDVNATWGIPEQEIKEPTETIIFGEKMDGEAEHYMDLLQEPLNDLYIIDNERHSKGNAVGGSNYAFCDTSVRYLKWGTAVAPLNLWGVMDWMRGTPSSPGDGTNPGGNGSQY
jgi:prepilin-type N-terminal cleavage/methylation domain-containing protein